jgi:uncharacterized protein
MSDDKALIREWMEITAMGPAEAWDGKVAPDVVVRLPYAPPGVLAVMNGFDEARDTLAHHWPTKRSWQWRDVVIRQTEDPQLYVITARSEVVLADGQPYANDYVMLTRVRDGQIAEHSEYFNPLPIMEMLGR